MLPLPHAIKKWSNPVKRGCAKARNPLSLVRKERTKYMKVTMCRVILMLLVCGSSNAAMYSCVDRNGTKTLKNYPCEQNEKQQVIETEFVPSIDTQAVRTPNAARNNSVKDEVCEKRRKEIDESTYQPTNLAGALVKQRNKQAYERDCSSNSSSDSGGSGSQKRKQTNAFFTGRMEQMLSGEWNCQYNYNGQNIWKIYSGFCPSNATGVND